ncbi:aminodeoxychorismate/anthranilate synthase component II [Fluviicola sp.]|uniref:anthranilate synthase component II n=1 Tax=Fluviicola sp. TaxID=1917219 RepID=UPI0026121E8D|nr:aminodeoxychorismate/anthranilate synthase component II [Fluviicola sp.]
MKIAVIDNFDSFVFNLIRYIKEEEHEVVVQRNNQLDFEVLESADGILLSPGPGIPSEAGGLLEVIRRFHGKKPILGVCLGHQAIAEHFGDSVIPCPEPIHGKASQITISKESGIFQNLPTEVEVGRYHSWQTRISPSSELEITASTKDLVVMAIQHKTAPTVGVQFHPESILTPLGRKMIQNWLNTYP